MSTNNGVLSFTFMSKSKNVQLGSFTCNKTVSLFFRGFSSAPGTIAFSFFFVFSTTFFFFVVVFFPPLLFFFPGMTTSYYVLPISQSPEIEMKRKIAFVCRLSTTSLM